VSAGPANVAVANLAYAHPGGDLLFECVSFRVAPGRHAGLIGTNGVGKTTLLRILAGELQAAEGHVAHGGRAAYMPQDVGMSDGMVRELLLSVAPERVREVGTAMLRAERELAAGDDDAGARLGEAIGTWSELGGYELEGRWDSACRRITRAGLDDIGDRPQRRCPAESGSAWCSTCYSPPTQRCCYSTSPTTSSTSRPSVGSRR
jgi:ATPase subunit of ABC transporter with duplicated ATPase domains